MTTPTTYAPLDKVAIIGTAFSRALAPFDDPAWKIWACSPGNRGALKRVDVWFELHALNDMLAPESADMSRPYFEWLKEESEKGSFNVVMQGVNQYVPKAIPFPRDEMLEAFGHNWFRSSIAWMMALAITRGAKTIGLFGVDMAAHDEHYSGQRASCTRFIEIAQERGIEVIAPFESSLMTVAPLYGYAEGSPFGRRLNAVLVEVTKALTARQQQIAALNNEMQYFAGAKAQLEYILRTWADGQELKPDYGPFASLPAPSTAATIGTEAPKIDLSAILAAAQPSGKTNGGAHDGEGFAGDPTGGADGGLAAMEA